MERKYDFKEIITLQNNIKAYISEDNGCDVFFEYTDSKESYSNSSVLTVITYNNITGATFKLVTIEGHDRINCLSKVMDYIQKGKIPHNILNDKYFTVEWSYINDSKTHLSYFTGINMKEVIDKFYFQIDPSDVIVYNIKLNPES